ncbi:NUDIX hydrolase [Cardinium endosymbiont of Culicoides punctatus]|uniref:NUDIX hydrolase n=1 Tax=Cardinium endosymbiont of Culicoides punctatus TaxID=2304601 RepID=UPI00105849DA|nr:NUDIX domain-containing protein [Cardinium endosymbiont of Culicoides punctatus]TDG93974.1 Isopentenyl-diphosphate Delta-isomerase [Cardinium endosymbiont of Culicoides punctatus]
MINTTKFVNGHIDVLNEQGLRKGYTLPRKEVHEKGEIHRAVHLYLFDKKGSNLLLQKRTATVDHYPNKYSISVVGHVNAGEYSHMAVKRELKEELGIDADQLDIAFLFSFRQDATLSPTYIDRQINDLYICYMDQEKDIKFNKKDVKTIEWVPFEKFQSMVEDASIGQGDLAPVYAHSCKNLIYFLAHKHTKY